MSMKSKNPVNTAPGINTLSVAGATFLRSKATSGHRGNGELAGQMAQDAAKVNGLDITKVYIAMFLAMSFFIGLFYVSFNIENWDYVPNFVQAILGNWFVALILMIVATFASIGLILGMFVTLPQLMGAKMKARVYDINGSSAKSAGRYESSPVASLISIIIGGGLFLTTAYPFFLLQNAFEVIRVAKSWVTGSPVAFRGDSGRYYDRLRTEYAKMLASGSSKTAAEDMLREACEGMFTPRNSKISMTDWNGGGRERILGTMIRRHGPIEAYVGKVTGQGSTISGKRDDLSGHGKDRDGVSRKYSAL